MATTAAAPARTRALTIQQVARRTGLARSTLRYYEQIGLIPPVDRDPDSGHRRFGPQVVETLEALSCLRGAGVRSWTPRAALPPPPPMVLGKAYLT